MVHDWLYRALLEPFVQTLPPGLRELARALQERWLATAARDSALRQALQRAHACFVRHAPADLARYARDNPLTDAASLLAALKQPPAAEAWEDALQRLIARAWRGLPQDQQHHAARLYTLCLRQALLPLPSHGLQALGRELTDQRENIERLLQAWQNWQQQQTQHLTQRLQVVAEEVHIKTEQAHIQTATTEIHTPTVVVRAPTARPEPPYTPPPPPDPDGPLPEPGTLPPGSRVPVPPNPYFTGREDILRKLARHLLNPPGFRALALVGPGGVGKTQVAATFARRFGPFFYGVLWVWPDQSLEDALAAWAEDLFRAGWFPGMRTLPEKAPERAAMVRALMQRHGPWLVVLDDPAPAQAPNPWLLSLADARVAVLLTSRRAEWPTHIQTLPLPVFTPHEARAFLQQRLPPAREGADREMDELTARLGRLPLALELAAAYLKRYRLTPTAYLNELDRMQAVLQHPSLQDAPASLPTGHPGNLHATLRLSLDRVRNHAPQAAGLFGYLGHLAPEQPVPLDLLALTQDPPWEEGPLREALATLADHSLMRWPEEDPGPRLHPLLAELARLEAAPPAEALQAWAQRVAEVFESRFEDEIEQQARYAAWAPYRDHLAALARAAGPTAAAARLWNLLGRYAWHLGEYEGARELYEQALAIRRQVYGEKHPAVATSLNNLAGVLWALGEYEGARELHEQALAIRRQVYGEKHPAVANSLNNLAGVLEALGEYEGARELHEQALAIRRQVYGEQHPDVATSLNNLALVLQALGEYEGAREHFEQALDIDREVYGEKHPEVATDLNNLAGVLWALGEYEQARELYKQALVIYRQVYGEKHPAVATSLNNLAGVLWALGEYEEARELYEQALVIVRQVYGEKHPAVATSLNNLALVLADLGEYEQARERHEQALAIRRQVYGEKHPDVATSLAGLAKTLEALGEYEQARELYEQALVILRQTLPPGHPHIRTVEDNLRRVRQKKGP